MRSLARLLPRQFVDRLPRVLLATILVLLLTSPLWTRNGSGFSDGYRMNAEPGAAAVARLLCLLLALAAPWLAEGIVSDLRLRGTGPFMLARPVPRAGVYLVRWVAGLAGIVVAAIAISTILNLISNLRPAYGHGLSIVGSAGGALIIWVWVGSVVLLLSAVLDRGEVLAGALVVVLPVALTVALPPGSLLAGAAELIPTRPMLHMARDLMAGHGPRVHELLLVSVWGFSTLWVGLVVATRRDLAAAD
ncbi:MAG: hypothetical protein ACWGON_01545 [Gemmatimonadota bacterium]